MSLNISDDELAQLRKAVEQHDQRQGVASSEQTGVDTNEQGLEDPDAVGRRIYGHYVDEQVRAPGVHVANKYEDDLDRRAKAMYGMDSSITYAGCQSDLFGPGVVDSDYDDIGRRIYGR